MIQSGRAWFGFGVFEVACLPLVAGRRVRRLRTAQRSHPPSGHRPFALLLAMVSMLGVRGCTDASPGSPAAARRATPAASPAPSAATRPVRPSSSPRAPSSPDPFRNLLPGMPPIVAGDVYGATRAGMLSRRVAHDPALLYVPDSRGSSVTIISQQTHKIVRIVHAGNCLSTSLRRTAFVAFTQTRARPTSWSRSARRRRGGDGRRRFRGHTTCTSPRTAKRPS